MEWRIEKDSMGEVRVQADRYWGAQTQRSIDNFRIGPAGSMPKEVIHAFGYQKKASAMANADLGVLSEEKMALIVRVCEEIVAGQLDEHFPLVVWQTGSGTQTNMNVNEVIARRGQVLSGNASGSEPRALHPNDDVNRSQSSNDTFPTAMHIAARMKLGESTLPALRELHQVFLDLSARFMQVVKVGRTHWMDAVPISFGQELSGYAAQIEGVIGAVERTLPRLERLALGGTAVGTGLNAPSGYAEKSAGIIAGLTGLPFVTAPNKFEALAAHDALVEAHGALRLAAVSLMKISGDLRAMASGPCCGLGEITIPSNEPGSSIMPGKVNPTQAEALAMVCARVIGNDVTLSIAGSIGPFELNVFKPVMISAFLESAGLLGDACRSFTLHCAVGIEPVTAVMEKNAGRSPMLVTALAPLIGYERATEIARRSIDDGVSIREAALASGWVSELQFDALADPRKMAGLDGNG
ncbi:MAG: class II fumarate hydratase [Chlorobiaceae bacterium]|nr:class II fumarate hydratase [Chlorobiaceae bacterium]